MNVVVLAGYISNETQYIQMINGEYEFRFYLTTHSTYSKDISAIPCKCIGFLADKIYSQVSENTYMEILGEIVRDESSKVYVRVLNATIKKPRSRRKFYMTASEYIKAYSPLNVLERVESNEDENK